MAHLEDKLAEFVFDELSAAEMEASRLHVAQCLECQGRIAAFESVRHSLEQVGDVDLPRRMVFLPPVHAPRKSWMPLAWGLPAAIAAVLVLAVWVRGPVRFETEPQAEPQIVTIEGSGPAVIDYEALDYGEIVDRIREEEAVWLRSELDGLLADIAAESRREVGNMRAELQYLYELQRVAQRETYLLAARTAGD